MLFLIWIFLVFPVFFVVLMWWLLGVMERADENARHRLP